MAGINLRYMQIVMQAKYHQELPGAALFQSFDRLEFLREQPTGRPGELRCLAHAVHAHPNAHLDEHDAYRVNAVLEATADESLLDISLSGPVAHLFASFSGVWWSPPTVLEQGTFHLTVRGTPGDIKAARQGMVALLGQRFKLTTVTSSLNQSSAMRTLSSRQSEVLSTALEMGYYDRPRGCTQRDIAEAMGVRQATVSEHLQAGEAKLVHAVYNEN
jgi:predicted DNA binding protein